MSDNDSAGDKYITVLTDEFHKQLIEKGRRDGVSIGVAKMVELADDFTTMSGALNGTASHWAAQMAIALRRAAGELTRDYAPQDGDP